MERRERRGRAVVVGTAVEKERAGIFGEMVKAVKD